MDPDRVTASTIPTETGLSIVYSPHFICESPDMSDPLSEVIALLQPAHRVLQAHQRRRPLGRPLLGLRPAELLRRARGQLSPRRRRPACHHARGGRLRAPAGDAGLHDVGLRAGDARTDRPEGDARPDGRSPPRHARRTIPTCGCSAATSSSTRPTRRCSVSLLPAVVHVRGVERLSVLVRLVGDESNEQRSGRDLVLTRLVEVLLIEALRSTPAEDAPPGLLRGLADARLAPAIRQMHAQLARSWTVAQLAKTAALSRSAFFERFTSHHGPAADGIPARVAHGGREESAPPTGDRPCRGRRTRRLRLGEHLQHSVQPVRRPASESLRARGLARPRPTGRSCHAVGISTKACGLSRLNTSTSAGSNCRPLRRVISARACSTVHRDL